MLDHFERVMKFKPGCRADADEWTCDGEKISDPAKLAAIRNELDKSGPVVLEHSFLRGGRGPRTLAFDDYDELVDYLTENARSGDHIAVWRLWPFMRDTPPLAQGKCPADDGAVPRKGPY